jgi:hypothetical protein
MKSRKRIRSELKGETNKHKVKRGGKRRRRHGKKEGTGTGTTKKKRRRLDSTSTTTTTHKRRIVTPLLYSLSTQLWLALLSLSSSIPNICFQLSGQENLNVPLALVQSTIGTNICGTAPNKHQIKDWNVLSMVDCWLGSNSDSITSWIKYVEKMDLFGAKHEVSRYLVLFK